MPGILKVRVVEARDLPIMDRATELTDAYVEVRFDDVTHKTPVCKKTLNPRWNRDFRFDVSDEELQDNALELRVWDQDKVSSDDIIGVVHVDVNPLVLSAGASQIAGWLPIFDTLRGIRGELSVIVKIELFSDVNRFRDSSLGVQFFASRAIPGGYAIGSLPAGVGLAFVEDVLVEEDPDFHFLDNFRTMRTSNDARRRKFSQITGELKRKIGLKVIELGGNSVIGFRQFLDIEGDYGIVARGIGTACNLVAQPNLSSSSSHGARTLSTIQGTSPSTTDLATSDTAPTDAPTPLDRNLVQRHIQTLHDLPLITLSIFPEQTLRSISGVVSARSVKILDDEDENELGDRDEWWMELRAEVRSHARALGCTAVVGYVERTSMSGDLMILTASGTAAVLKLTRNQHSSTSAATTRSNPSVGGGASGASGGRSTTRRRRQESLTVDGTADITSDSSHDPTSASAAPVSLADTSPLTTAAAVAIPASAPVFPTSSSTSPHTPSLLPEPSSLTGANTRSAVSLSSSPQNIRGTAHACKWRKHCSVCHVPYTRSSSPLTMQLVRCRVCRRGYVPEIMFSTVEPPPELQVHETGRLVEARVARTRKKGSGESAAIQISEMIPFVDYDLHMQLLKKLKILGMNAMFAMSFHIAIEEGMIVAIISGTAMLVAALPMPSTVRISPNVDTTDENILELKRRVEEQSESNRSRISAWKAMQVERVTNGRVRAVSGSPVGTGDDRDDDASSSSGESDGGDLGPEEDESRTAFIVEIDDETDEEQLALLFDAIPDESVLFSSCEAHPGDVGGSRKPVHVQQLTAFHRVTFASPSPMSLTRQLSDACNSLHQSFWLKLKPLWPVSLSNFRYELSLDSGALDIVATCAVSLTFPPNVSMENRANLLAYLAPGISSAAPAPLFHPLARSGHPRSARRRLLSHDSATSDDLQFELDDTTSVDGEQTSASFARHHARQGSDGLTSTTNTNATNTPQTTRSHSHSSQQPPTATQSLPQTPQHHHPHSLAHASSQRTSQALLSTATTSTPPPIRRVIITSCSEGSWSVTRFLGHVTQFVIKESTGSSVRDTGGLSSFVHVAMMEGLAILRAHVAALGGNLLSCYSLDRTAVIDSQGRNSAYLLLVLSGDALEVVSDQPHKDCISENSSEEEEEEGEEKDDFEPIERTDLDLDTLHSSNV